MATYKSYFFTYTDLGFPCLHGPFPSEPDAVYAGHRWQEKNEDDPRWQCVGLLDAEARIWFDAVDDTAAASLIDEMDATQEVK